MRSSTQSVRRVMRELSSATCPRLAAATGLSLVTVHKEVRRLCDAGELRAAGCTTRGGRPARVYEFCAGFATLARLSIRRSGAVYEAELLLTDLQRRPILRKQSTYAFIEPQSLDGLLDSALPPRRLAGIALYFTPAIAREDIRDHLQRRYSCPVTCVTTAEDLADPREGAATLYLRRGDPPQCCIRRHGQLHPTGRLDLLPLPCPWEQLNYEDHTLVEEMISRLLHIITCTLAPSRIILHADFWTPRLTERIRFNTTSKLRPLPPPSIDFIDN